MAAVLLELDKELLVSDRPQVRNTEENIVLFEHYGPCIGSAYVPLLEPNAPLLTSFYPHNIVVSSLVGNWNTSKLERIVSLQTSNRIVAFNTVKPAGLDIHWLLVLTDTNEFFALALSKSKSSDDNLPSLIVLKHMDLLAPSMKGKKKIDIESQKKIITSEKSFMKVDETGRFIFIYSVADYITILELKPSKRELFYLATVNRPPREVVKTPVLATVDKNRVFEKPQTESLITRDKLLNIELTFDDEYWWLAVISRDRSLNFSLGFYKLVGDDEFEYYQSFFSLTDCPNLIIPMGKFFYVIYDSYHVICYYPDYGIHFDNMEKKYDAKTMIFNYRESYIRQNVFVNNGYNKFITSYTKINDRKLLLATATSEYYTVELDYDFIPYDSLTIDEKKLNSDEQGLTNTLIFRDWKIKELSGIPSGNGLQPDQIFYDSKSETIITVNKNSEISTFKFRTIKNPHIVNASKLSLPITHLDTANNAYSAGNLQRGYFKTPEFEIKLKNETVENFLTFESYYVTLNSAISYDITHNSCSQTVQRLDVYLRNGDYVASYDFEENITVTDMMSFYCLPSQSMDDLTDHQFYEENIDQLKTKRESTFIVITSSSNENDYDNETDYVYRKRTEVLLFSIQKETNDLELKTMSVIKEKVDTIEQKGNMVYLWGNGSCHIIELQLYKDSTSKNAQLKFKFKSSDLELEIDTVSIVRNLKYGFKLFVDPYFGIYLGEILDDKVIKLHQIFEWDMISALEVFSEDLIVVGDMLGNIFLLNMDYTNSETPTCNLFSCFNTTYGSIGSISCFSKYYSKDLNDENSLISVCKVGTSDGAILRVYISETLKNKKFLHQLKLQNLKTLKIYGLNFEHIARNIKVENLKLSSADPLTVYEESKKLLDSRFIKVSVATDTELSRTDENIPVVFF